MNKHNRILKGPEPAFLKEDIGIGEYFFRQADKCVKNIFQIDGDTEKAETFRDVKRRSTRVSIHLQQLGIEPKDVVMLCCKNNLDNIVPALATVYLGGYICSVAPTQTVQEVKNALSLVEPKVVFVEETSLELIENGLMDMSCKPRVIVIGQSTNYERMQDMEKAIEGEDAFKPVKQRGRDVAFIVFSSGTTGAPKGIYISNWYVLYGAVSAIQHNNIKPGVLVHFSSLFWVSALTLTGFCIVTGTAKVIAPRIKPERFLQLVEKFKVTYAFTSSTYTYDITNLSEAVINKYDTASLHYISVGGSTMDPRQLIRMRKLFPHTNVALAYGSSETNLTSGFDFTKKNDYMEKVSSSGSLLAEVEMKVVDLESGDVLGPKQSGEIRIKTPYGMVGYHNLNKPDAFDEDGFLKIGDVGYYDEDGYIYVTDRINDMFKFKTNQVSPSILEHMLAANPNVEEAVVFGIPHPVDRFHPAACVVLRKGGEQITEQELIDFVHSKVSDPYRLRGGLMIVDSIIKTPSGKVQRRTMRDKYVQMREEKYFR